MQLHVMIMKNYITCVGQLSLNPHCLLKLPDVKQNSVSTGSFTVIHGPYAYILLATLVLVHVHI